MSGAAPASIPNTPAPAATPPPAAAPSPAPASGGTPPPVAGGSSTPAMPDWMQGFTDERRGFVTNKGWKTNGDMLESYQNLEKLVHTSEDKLIRLPAAEDKEGWDGLYSRLGRPVQPADYKIEAAKEGGDPKFAEWASKNFHELGLSTKQGQELAQRFSAYGAQMKSDGDAATIAKLQQGQEALKKEWGAAHEQNINIAKRGSVAAGMDKATLDKIESVVGFDGVMRLFHNVGRMIGEGSFTTGDAGNGMLTPQQAQDKISAFKSDPGWVKRYTEGDAHAKAEMQRLHQMAYQGEMTI